MHAELENAWALNGFKYVCGNLSKTFRGKSTF